MSVTTSSAECSSNIGKTLNLFCGVGFGSRFTFCIEKLVSLGWTLQERASGGRKRKLVSFTDPSGKKFKSENDVERFLKENNLWENVKRDSDHEDVGQNQQNEQCRDKRNCDVADANSDSHSEQGDSSDEDYNPFEDSFQEQVSRKH